MLKLRRLLSSLALSAVVGLMASECRAETISMTVSVTGAAAPLVLDGLAGVTPGATSYNVSGNAGPGNYPGTGAFTAINAYLAANGSIYQLTSLSGNSNFPGSPLPANLTVTGEIHAVATGGTNAGLTLIESEHGFTNPSAGTPATLTSSSSGNFTNANPGTGHEANSTIGGPPTTSTPSYTVLSTSTAVNPGVNTGPRSAAVASTPTLYTLTNIITWGVSAPALNKPPAGAPDVIDQFGVTAQVNAVPEPASVVVFLTGMPLPLAVVFGLMRRRRGVMAR
jgi:hypothetical protein